MLMTVLNLLVEAEIITVPERDEITIEVEMNLHWNMLNLPDLETYLNGNIPTPPPTAAPTTIAPTTLLPDDDTTTDGSSPVATSIILIACAVASFWL